MSPVEEDYERLVKDHLRMKLTEGGWVELLTQLIKSAIDKRIEDGQTTKTIKFDQLYGDVITKARGNDAVANDTESDFHSKINELLILNFDQTNEPAKSTMITDVPSGSSHVPSVSPGIYSADPSTVISYVSSDIISDVPPNVPSNNVNSDLSSVIPSDVIIEDDVWMESKYPYFK